MPQISVSQSLLPMPETHLWCYSEFVERAFKHTNQLPLFLPRMSGLVPNWPGQRLRCGHSDPPLRHERYSLCKRTEAITSGPG